MIDLTMILEAVVALAVAVISAFVIPWINSKTDANDREDLLKWVDIAVAAAQQLFHQMNGAQRLDYALSFLEQQGFDVDDAAVLNAVEAAVLKLHQEMDKTVYRGVTPYEGATTGKTPEDGVEGSAHDC